MLDDTNAPTCAQGLYSPAPDLVATEDHDTFYLVPPLSAPRQLNLSASSIWRRIGRGEPLDDIVSAYAADYDCTLREAGEDVRGFVAEMTAAGFLVARAGEAPRGGLPG